MTNVAWNTATFVGNLERSLRGGIIIIRLINISLLDPALAKSQSTVENHIVCAGTPLFPG